MLSDTFSGLAAWHGLKFLVGAGVVLAFLVTVSAPHQAARHQAEASAAARLASCVAAKATAPDALGRFLDRATCRVGG